MGKDNSRTKAELRYYLECDKIALKIPLNRKRPRPFFDCIWKYQRILRKVEYYSNKESVLCKAMLVFYKLRLKNLGIKLGFSIDPFVFGPGLSIAHYGCITVNPNARVGSNCRIHEGVTLGATNGESGAPIIGDNCFIGSGAKIIGQIEIGNDVAIGAGAVVVKSCEEDGVTLGGVPASIISHNNSSINLVNATTLYQSRLETKQNDKK